MLCSISILALFSLEQVKAQSALTGVATGRYEMRGSTKVESATDSSMKKNSAQKKSTSGRAPASEMELSLKKSDGAVQPSVSSSSSTEQTVTELPTKVETKPEDSTKEPAISEHMESIFDSKIHEVLEYYQKRIDAGDIRKNKIEADLIPKFVYWDSRSNYSYRRYTTQFVSLDLKATAWFTPRLGLFGNFATSLAGELESGNANKDKLSAKFERYDLGLSFRSFDDFSKNSDSTELLVKIMGSSLVTPSDSDDRSSLRSSGLGLGLRNRFGGSLGYKWVLGGTLYPRINHSESSTAGAGNSGKKGDSVRMELEFGGEIETQRRSQMLWLVNYGFERNTFRGAATVADPETSTTPSNVGASTTTLSFGLGYRWGR